MVLVVERFLGLLGTELLVDRGSPVDLEQMEIRVEIHQRGLEHSGNLADLMALYIRQKELASVLERWGNLVDLVRMDIHQMALDILQREL